MNGLDGPRERVKRANRQIASLQRGFQSFFKDNLYEIGVAEFNPKTSDYSLRVKSGPEDFPVEWPLLIGEIAHNLRSALDGLAWQLALLKTSTPYERTAFPIYLLGRTIRRTKSGSLLPHFWARTKRGKLEHGLRLIQDIPRPLWARMESFQPYKRGHGGRRSALLRLQELNNTDKHRFLTVLGVLPASMSFTGISGGTRFYPRVPLRPNAKVGWVRDVPPNEPGADRGAVYLLDPATGSLMEPEMQVNINITPGVVFGDTCQAVERLPVIRTLQRIADEVSRVVESFADEFPA